jgi:hypothetical protein
MSLVRARALAAGRGLRRAKRAATCQCDADRHTSTCARRWCGGGDTARRGLGVDRRGGRRDDEHAAGNGCLWRCESLNGLPNGSSRPRRAFL